MEPTWRRRANHVSSSRRAVGGHLWVEGGELRFEPHKVDRALAAQGWSVPLDAIDAVVVVGRRPVSHFFAGGLRRQLGVEAGGETTCFVLNGVEKAAAELRALIG